MKSSVKLRSFDTNGARQYSAEASWPESDMSASSQTLRNTGRI